MQDLFHPNQNKREFNTLSIISKESKIIKKLRLILQLNDAFPSITRSILGEWKNFPRLLYAYICFYFRHF